MKESFNRFIISLVIAITCLLLNVGTLNSYVEFKEARAVTNYVIDRGRP